MIMIEVGGFESSCKSWGDDRESCEEVEKRLGEYCCRGDIERKSQSFAYLRPNLLYTRKFVIVHSTFSASSEE
jgi:hypothetical protein